MSEASRPIVVVGSINMDLVSRVPSIPKAGETISGSDFKMYPGGKGANQAVGVARLGYPVVMIGMLGADAFGRELRGHLNREGVDTTHVGEVPSASGLATILVDDAGENCIVVASGANNDVTPEVLRSKQQVLAQAGIVLAQLEIPMDSVECLMELCESFDVPLILDPAPARAFPQVSLRGVSWITPNETEATYYVPQATSEQGVLDTLFGMGARGVILKQGAKGVMLAQGDGMSHRVATPPVKVVDTTAAGDAFNAAFAVALMRGSDPVEAAKFATTAAAISVSRAGAQPSLATRLEIDAALQQNR